MITSGYQKFAESSMYCGSTAQKVYKKESDSLLSCIGKEFGARVLYLAQAVGSVAMLALNLVVTFFLSLAAICFEGPTKAWELFKVGMAIEWGHYAFLPCMVLGILLPQ